MFSFDIDYLFNRVYDVLLWIKYVYLFSIMNNDPKQYLADHEDRVWDGLRDRGWLDFAKDPTATLPPEVHQSLWDKFLAKIGWKLPDTDGDGIPDLRDPSPYDQHVVTTSAQLKERYQQDYDFGDKVRDFFGMDPKDTDKDGVLDSYELAHHLDPKSIDSDHDGLSDGQELTLGTDPLNNDTDSDTIIDGRDEAPLDPQVSSIGTDTDGDGVSDKIEAFLKMDIHNKDTDSDGIPDGMDTYPLDPTNIGNLSGTDFSLPATGLHFSIQNSFLGFIADLYSVIGVFVLLIFAITLLRWFYIFWEGQMHYEHHFGHGDDHHDNKSHSTSATHHTPHSPTASEHTPMGIPGLAIMEDHIAPPEVSEYRDHPRWAIVEGYLSSDQEPLWRIGILEADNMLADALREKGYAGADVGEMLQSANFKSVQLAWDAHKVRNRIAHEGSLFTLTEREAKRAYALYEAVFREMKLI
jgi:hypothetical protein